MAMWLHWTGEKKRGPWCVQLLCVGTELPPSKRAVPQEATRNPQGLAGRGSPLPPALPPSGVSARQGEQVLCCKVFPAARPTFSSSLVYLMVPTPPPSAV